jgi:predicted kinase
VTHLIVVTGHPASGKTTLAGRLAGDLNLPLITKDLIKETLYDSMGTGDRERSRQLGHASFEVLFAVLEALLAAGTSCIIEANFDPVHAGLALDELRSRHRFSIVQILCHADDEVLVERFVARDASGDRHPGHVDGNAEAEIRARLAEGPLRPLDIPGPVIEVDTTEIGSIDYDTILRQVRDAIGSG